MRGSGAALTAGLLCVLGVTLALAACQREKRDFEVPPSASIAIKSVRLSDITPGGPMLSPGVGNPDEQNAQALADGKRLFNWYNCSGCHGQGGGAQGPALMDNVWIYGSEPANVFATIVQGRPNGMPSFGGRIPESEVWELVAYVRSLSGLASQGAAPGRGDTIAVKKPESDADRQPPVQVSAPTP
jgi:cytochrome c oxidase cbb3-type subunit 3